MEQIPQVVAAARANLHEPAPRALLETAIRQNRGRDWVLREGHVRAWRARPRSSRRSKSAAARVRGVPQGLPEVPGKRPAAARPRASGGLGGRSSTASWSWSWTPGLTADQVLADAEAEFDRVQREMYVIARQLWSRYFPQQALPPDDAAGRRDDDPAGARRASARTTASPKRSCGTCGRPWSDIKRFIREHDILRLPDPDPCQIIEMPEFQRGNSTAYMNSPPPLDPERHRAFTPSARRPRTGTPARVKSYLEEYNRHMLPDPDDP